MSPRIEDQMLSTAPKLNPSAGTKSLKQFIIAQKRELKRKNGQGSIDNEIEVLEPKRTIKTPRPPETADPGRFGPGDEAALNFASLLPDKNFMSSKPQQNCSRRQE